MKVMQLQYFVEVVKCNNISQAAKKLFVSQPAISTAIKELENEFHTSFFIRYNNQLTLTDEGKYFYYKAVELLGLPEGRIPLAQAVIYVARAPKSNETVCAIDAAISDISNGKDYPPPMHLRDAHYKDASKYGFGIGYVYSHEAPEIEQQFLPDELINRKYTKGQ